MKHIINPDCERLLTPVELKFVGDPAAGRLEGYASVFNLEHESGDFVEPGAFRKTIAERVPAGRVPYLDTHQWDAAHTLGTVVSAHEDSRGLAFAAQLSAAPSVSEFRQKVAEGHIKFNSIGFVAVREQFKRAAADLPPARHIQEVKLYEISAVPIPDDPGARITAVKSAVPYQDLPIAERDRAWDAAAAESRVRRWAGGDGNLNFARYRRAFLWFDAHNADQLGAYKLPIADMIGGELIAVPRAIFSAAEVIQGGRGGVNIPDADLAAVKSAIARYYAKMATQFGDDSIVPPWEGKSAERSARLIVDLGNIDGYSSEQLTGAARMLVGAMSTEARARLIADLSAGPATPPTADDASGRGAALRRRALRLKSELTRRKIT